MSGLSGDWSKLESILNPSRLAAGIQQAAGRVGNYGASQVKKGIVSGAPAGKRFAPLNPVTIARKGSSKPLIDKGDLVGSVTYQVIDSNNVFVGVKKGKEVNIAAVHEFGCTIGVTPKMRAYLHPSRNTPKSVNSVHKYSSATVFEACAVGYRVQGQNLRDIHSGYREDV